MKSSNRQYPCFFNSFICTGPPAIIADVRASDICLTDVTISWNPVTSDPVCGPVSYDVTISPSDGVMMMRITDTSYNITGLTPDNSYTVTVAGRNDAGVGESSLTNVTTLTDSKLNTDECTIIMFSM